MAKCKECYHYSACFEMAKINLQMCGISDYDGNADGCKDFIAAENVVILNPERTIATKLPAQTHNLPCGGYQEVDSVLDIPAAKAKMIEDIKAEIEQIYSADDSWFIHHVDDDGDDFFTVGWKLTICRQGESELTKMIKSLYGDWIDDIPAAGALWKQLQHDINYEERLAETEKRKIRFKKYEPLKEEGRSEGDAEI